MPLRGVLSFKDTSSRIIRLQQKLSEYDYEIYYKKGKINASADFLSRLPQNSAEECLILTRQQARLECEGSSGSTERIKTTVDRKKIMADNEIDSVSEEDDDINYPIE